MRNAKNCSETRKTGSLPQHLQVTLRAMKNQRRKLSDAWQKRAAIAEYNRAQLPKQRETLTKSEVINTAQKHGLIGGIREWRYDFHAIPYDEEFYAVNSWLSWEDFPHIAFTSHAVHWQNKKDKYYSLKYTALTNASRADLFSWLSDIPNQADILGALMELKELISQ